MNLGISIEKNGAILNGKGPEVIQAGLDRLIDMIVQFLTVEVKKRTPQGAMGAQGGLLGSIQNQVVGKGTPMIKGIVASAQKYAEVIEKGRDPGKAWPPEGVLLRWIEVKMGLSGEEAKRVEFLVRRKIGQKGFPGRHMFEHAVSQNLGRIDSMAEAEGFKISSQLDS
jgi:hypothetical protein